MTAPQPRTVAHTPYEVCAYHTRTGKVAGWIPLADIPDWQRGLNITGSWSVQVALDSRYLSKEELTGLSGEWDWSWAIVQGTHIHQAGPVRGEDYSTDGASTTTIMGSGLLALLAEKRVLVNAARATVGGITTTDADFPFGPGTVSEKDAPIPADNRFVDLTTVIIRLFENALAEPGGDLPIDLPTDTYPGVAERSFPGYELGTVGARALDITQVIDGPELELVPRFTDTKRQFVRHRLLVGVPSTNPDINGRLGNLSYPHVWDTGRGLCELSFSRNGERRSNRAWQKGEGTDRAAAVGFAQDLTGVTVDPGAGTRPLLETVDISHARASETDGLQGYAESDIANGARSELTLRAVVRIDGTDGQGGESRSPLLPSVSPGDTGVVTVTDHQRLPDGPYEVRVLRISGTRDPDTASLDVQVLSGGFP